MSRRPFVWVSVVNGDFPKWMTEYDCGIVSPFVLRNILRHLSKFHHCSIIGFHHFESVIRS